MICRRCKKEMLFIAENGRKILGVRVKQIALACWDCGIATIQEYQEKDYGLGKKVVSMR